MKATRFLDASRSCCANLWHGTDASMLLALASTLLISAFCFLYDLGAYPIRDINEGLYVEIAREMLVSGQYIIPHLNGVPYIEKPPLLYWMIALAFQFFGPSAGAARLVSALSMMAVAIGLALFCRRLGYSRAGLFAAVILSTSAPVVVLSRTVLFDPLLTALISGCLLSFFLWYLRRSRNLLVTSAILLALATLEKGAVAIVMAGGVVALYLLLMRDRTTLRALADPVAAAVFLAITVPWHCAASVQQEGFAWFYFINEHLLRFVGLRQPQDYQSGPIHYFLPRLLLMMFPWTPLFALLTFPGKKTVTDRAAVAMTRFCIAWIIFPVLFFSLSQAKAQYYILVVAPAIALLFGVGLEHRLRHGPSRRIVYGTATATACGVAALFIALHPERDEWRHIDGAPLIAGVVVLCVAVGYVVVRLFQVAATQDAFKNALVMLPAMLTVPLLMLILRAADAQSLSKSSQAVAEAIERHAGKSVAVFVYRDFEDLFSSLPFYLERQVKVIDSASRDLQFGCRAAARRESETGVCVSISEFNHTLSRTPVAVVVHKDRLEAFWKISSHHDYTRIESVGGKWIFFNR